MFIFSFFIFLYFLNDISSNSDLQLQMGIGKLFLGLALSEAPHRCANSALFADKILSLFNFRMAVSIKHYNT